MDIGEIIKRCIESQMIQKNVFKKVEYSQTNLHSILTLNHAVILLSKTRHSLTPGIIANYTIVHF